MSHTLAPADASHYYQRLAELSTVPLWQGEKFTEPAGPERIPAWTWHQLTAGEGGLVLLRLTDRPIHDAFGPYRAEEEV
jgi:hypothetical protein